jgi:cation diffusion facilitator CzcD-associated flavoprotein CzcO
MSATDTDIHDVDVAILGSGFSGLGMAIRMRQAGFEDFVVLERGDEVGGTWHYNTYPGCACDVPSHLYSFSFAPNPEWSQTYSPQPEIRDYLRRCADEFGLGPFLRLGHEITSAEWDEDAQRWHVATTRGDFRARVIVSGLGPLTEPKIPEIPGLESFEGTTFHSARWDHDYDLTGKRVASIGTGASAIQYVPAIQPQVRQLHVFQRTPPWIAPHGNRPITGLERRLYRALPAAQRLVRAGVYASREALVLGFVKNPRLMKVVEQVARRHMRRYISDPELIRKVTPDYTIGCKRILPSNRWYDALTKPNVELITDGVTEVRPRSIVSADGVEREVDAIVFGTGFHVTDMPATRYLRGRHGRLLSDDWEHSPRAYLGTAAPGFPNLFLLLGPNTGLGHSSMVYMIESQIQYVMDALRTMRRREIETVEVLESAVDRYNGELERKMEGTVWTTGCASWYLDDTGRNATQWPDWTWRFRQRTARFDPSDYAVRAPAPARERVPVAA